MAGRFFPTDFSLFLSPPIPDREAPCTGGGASGRCSRWAAAMTAGKPSVVETGEEPGSWRPLLPGRLCTQHCRGAAGIYFQPKNNTFQTNEFAHWISAVAPWLTGDCWSDGSARPPSPVLLGNKDRGTFFSYSWQHLRGSKTWTWWLMPVNISILSQCN